MKDLLETLAQIETNARTIGETMRKEQIVYKAELDERLKLGLTGDEAINHYNNWMKKYKMFHLIIK